MAEFTEIWENWQRMCHYQKDLGDGDCMYCPLRRLECNSEYPKDQIHYDGKAVEEIIAKWAAEHPEPKYPTWREWLISIGVIDQMSTHSVIADILAMTPIPADVAEKLGIDVV